MRPQKLAALFLALFLSVSSLVQPVLSMDEPGLAEPGTVPVSEQGPFSQLPQESEIDTDWTIERIDEARMFDNMGNRSLALDAAGYPHIAYGEDSLYYAHYDGVSWQVETVDSAPRVGWHTSLVLDAAGNPHISYCRWTYLGLGGGLCTQLKYAHYDGVTWTTETVDTENYVGDKSSLALDAAGNPHISYCRRTCDSWSCFCSEVKYARYDGATWFTEVVDGGGDPSLALDAAGLPRVSYCQMDPDAHYCHSLRYARYDGASWITETVDGNANAQPSLVLDTAGRPHIGYSGGGAKYAHYDGTTWITATVDGALSGDTSLALDAAGRPHLSYMSVPPYGLRYAHFDGSSWITETLTSGSPNKNSYHKYTSLALDGDGLPAIGFRDESSEDLLYARYDGTSWSIETMDRKDLTGRYPALALDARDRPHVSYSHWDTTGGELRYAYSDGMGWRTEIVDRADDKEVGTYSSLALDGGNLPHISYYDASNTDLKYAYYNGTDWISETVDSAGSVGEYTSLALDENGYPHVSYRDVTRGDLKYAAYDGTGWRIETVDSNGNTGWFTSLALDTAGRPHISYCLHDSYDCVDLMYAWYDGTAWITETVANGGGYTSLALDSAGRPHIAYQGGYFGDLVYAHFDGTTWQSEILYSGGTEGESGLWASLELDPAGRPHISFGQHFNSRFYACGALYYIYYDGSAWQHEPVDGCSEMGMFTAYSTLALDSQGRPHIGYLDLGGGDLKYAHPACVPVGSASIAGPLALLPNQPGIYQASAWPFTTSVPITFTWDNGAVGATATYSWPATGTYTLNVTATNDCGQGWGQLNIRVLEEWPYRFYLPVVSRAAQRRGPSTRPFISAACSRSN